MKLTNPGLGLLLALAWPGLPALVRGSDAPPDRVIAADWQQVLGPRSDLFRECVGAGRAAEGLRAEWQRQLKLCRDEIGFKYIRFHGLLSDDMAVYAEARDGTPRHNWQYIDQLYDALLATGVRPFVELSFMPSALASGSKTIFWWKANVTPPKDYAKWDALITDLVRHWTERYGADEVKTWPFEVWNEPDYPGFWGPSSQPDKGQAAYFELYAHTAAAIRAVNAGYRVGGPAGATTTWIRPLIAETAARGVPLDFISYHTYGLGGGASGLDEYGEQLHYLGSNLLTPAATANGQRAVIDASARPGLPVHITEWSTSYSPRDPVHDAYFSAPYILAQLRRAGAGVASMSYWVFTDIFEESGPPLLPFHGGFGLLTVQGLRKPAYFAYQFLGRLGPTELVNTDRDSWVTRDDRGGVQVLLWNLTDPTEGGRVSNQVAFRSQLAVAHPAGDVTVNLEHLPPGDYRLTRWQVGYQKNDAYTAWLGLGSPAQLTRAQEQQLAAAASGRPESVRTVPVAADGRFAEKLPLREIDVVLLTLERR